MILITGFICAWNHKTVRYSQTVVNLCSELLKVTNNNRSDNIHMYIQTQTHLEFSNSFYRLILARFKLNLIRSGVKFTVLRHRVGANVVTKLFSSLNGSLHQPLYHWKDVDKIQTLYLMRVKPMRTFHTRKNNYNLLSQSTTVIL